MNKEKTITIEKVPLRGDRVKDEMKRKNGQGSGHNGRFTNDDLAAVIDYNWGKTVSCYISNKHEPIAKDKAEKLATFFGVRIEYLIGQDDFRTHADLVRYLNLRSDIDNLVEDDPSIQLKLDFLRSCGIDISFCIVWVVKPSDLWSSFREMAKCIYTPDLSKAVGYYGKTSDGEAITEEVAKRFHTEQVVIHKEQVMFRIIRYSEKPQKGILDLGYTIKVTSSGMEYVLSHKEFDELFADIQSIAKTMFVKCPFNLMKMG